MSGHDGVDGLVAGVTSELHGNEWSLAQTYGCNSNRASGSDLLTMSRDASKPSLWNVLTHDFAVAHEAVSVAARTAMTLPVITGMPGAQFGILDYNLASTLRGAYGEVGIRTEEKMRLIKTSVYTDFSHIPVLNPATNKYPNSYGRNRFGFEHICDLVTGSHNFELGYEGTFMSKIRGTQSDAKSREPKYPMPAYKPDGSVGLRLNADMIRIGVRAKTDPLDWGIHIQHSLRTGNTAIGASAALWE
jgi:hypothetical protein